MRKSFLAATLIAAAYGAEAGADSPGDLAVYKANCAACHGISMAGSLGPPLSGTAFAAKWSAAGEPALAAFIRQNMPPSNPGQLSPDDYTQLAALIMQRNAVRPDLASANTNEGGGYLPAAPNEDAVYQAAMDQRQQRLNRLTPVTDAMLLHPSPDDWLQWRRTYDGYGFSPLTAINKKSVQAMRVAWALALPPGTNGIIPLAHEGVLFVNGSGTVLAIDAATGDTLWTFNRPATASAAGTPVSQPRGMALFEQTLFVPTIDNHMIALDIKSGKVLWDHLMDASKGTLRVTGAPLVLHDKIIVGFSGCAGTSEPHGCFVAALDTHSGQELWRFYTIPRPGEPGSNTWNGASPDQIFGASLWSGGTYDPVNNLLFFGTGQTYHISVLMTDSHKAGVTNSALYTDTTLALNPDTGKLAWYYQHMARDVWDLDWAFERQIVDLPTKIGTHRVVMTMGKLGILDVLDARTGKYLFSYDMGYQTLVKSIDAKTGRKITDPNLEPRNLQPITVCPHATGVRNWPSTSYDAAAGILYVPFANSCMDLIWNKGADFDIAGITRPPEGGDRNFGGLAAIDLRQRKSVWTKRQRAPSSASALATAGGLVFYGGRDRVFRAADAESGNTLWQLKLDGVPSSTPITFMADGIQYVAVATGGGSPNEAAIRTLTPELTTPGAGVRLWLFQAPPP